MSQENVEVVRRFVDQARETPDAVWDIFDEDVEWELDPGSLALPDVPPRSHGPDASDTSFVAWSAASSTGTTRSRSRLMLATRSSFTCTTGDAAKSGAPVEARFWQVWTMRDGKAVRVTHHVEKAEALEAAGLRE